MIKKKPSNAKESPFSPASAHGTTTVRVQICQKSPIRRKRKEKTHPNIYFLVYETGYFKLADSIFSQIDGG